MVGHICLPINLDAFVLNDKVCDGTKTRIAPITQPDYVALRLGDSVVPQDILPQIDLHLTNSAVENPRISTAYSAPLDGLKLANPMPKATEIVKFQESRLGVYLHWSLPRGYRSGGSAASPSSQAASSQSKNSSTDTPSSSTTTAQPKFRLVPNRWLVVRRLQRHEPAQIAMPDVDAWVVESDRLRTLDKLQGDFDLETDITPYVAYDANVDQENLLYSQAEQYIGYKASLQGWSEQNPRNVPLTAINSSNPVFADYTIHNPNVFSIKDNFETATPGQYLTSALCDYFVVGWHSSTGDDPFGTKGLTGTLKSRLSTFLCQLDTKSLHLDADPDKAQTQLKAIENDLGTTSVLCHGTIYGVSYQRSQKPANIKGDKYFDNFQPTAPMEPVTIGTTPLDSILTFLQAHQDEAAAEETVLGQGSSTIAEPLVNMSKLLYATDDNFDSRVKAADLLFYQNFKGSIGGFRWKFDKTKDPQNPGPPASPNKDEKTYLSKLNDLQERLDILDRMLALCKWSLFAEFFKYCSDPFGKDNRATYRTKVDALYLPNPKDPQNPSGLISSLLKAQSVCNDGIASVLQPVGGGPALVQAKKVAKDPFFLRADPTLTIAGMDSGWPDEYLDKVKIRLANDLTPSSNDQVKSLLSKFDLPATSGALKDTITTLLNEAMAGQGGSKIGFKQWTGQPFCPIFVEWEALFYNVEWDKWDIELVSSSIDTTSNHVQVRYGNPKPLFDGKLDDIIKDTRAISGRILVLPQPSFSLAAIVKQVLSTAGNKLPDDLPADQDTFTKAVAKLPFVSGEMMGFTDSLLTLGTGAHVKPNLRVQGDENVTPLPEALIKGAEIGMTNEHFRHMGAETSKTPFGSAYNFTGMHQPFKGVQHGQLVITKLNIVDKFGQVVPYLVPKPVPTVAPALPDAVVHPCLSDQLCPTILDEPKHTLNTVWSSTDKPTAAGGVLSPFIQITPAINQEARMNASYMALNPDILVNSKPSWQPCEDWDTPIFGWIIVNFADSALQFFTGNGLFYTSVRYGGPGGTVKGLKWAPFAEPPASAGKVSSQLIDLISQMQDDAPGATTYLNCLWQIIESATNSMSFPPSEYAPYANAIVGKPLALVNVGLSLELAQPVLKHQHTLGPVPGKDNLLTEEQMISQYNFKVKIGDYDRAFDGIVCYWDTDSTNPGASIFKKIYTPFPQPGPAVEILPKNYPTLTPTHIDASNLTGDGAMAKAKQYLVKTLLVDPYTSLNLYSGILPIKTIKIPSWNIQDAMKNMTAFFTLGPLLVTQDVPKTYNLDANARLTAESWLQVTDNPQQSNAAAAINLPIAGGKGMWNWLQPYVDDTDSTDPPRPVYNALEVGQEDGRLRADPAPYTLLEGFLQLARPLQQ